MNESVGLEKPISKVPMTPKLERLLNPNLNSSGEPIFTAPIRPPREGEKIYVYRGSLDSTIRTIPGLVRIANRTILTKFPDLVRFFLNFLEKVDF